MSDYKAFYEMVKKWMVKDYRTPHIMAEVTINMLISEFVPEMLLCMGCDPMCSVRCGSSEKGEDPVPASIYCTDPVPVYSTGCINTIYTASDHGFPVYGGIDDDR